MKTLSLFVFFCLLVSHNLTAQEQNFTPTNTKIITNLCEKTVIDAQDGFLTIDSKELFDLIILTDKNGKVILKETPKNNKIAIQSIKPGFYMLCAYCNGVKVKKGIFKKQLVNTVAYR